MLRIVKAVVVMVSFGCLSVQYAAAASPSLRVSYPTGTVAGREVKITGTVRRSGSTRVLRARLERMDGNRWRSLANTTVKRGRFTLKFKPSIKLTSVTVRVRVTGGTRALVGRRKTFKFRARTPVAPPPPPERTMTFDYTSADGWHYAGSLPLPEQRITVTKDVSSSPPGSARVAISVVGDSAETAFFNVDNPGRPNGPVLRLGPAIPAYEVTGGFVSVDGSPCNTDNNDSFYQFQPYGVILRCPPNGTSSGVSDRESSETDVDELIQGVRGFNPTFVLSFVGPTCNIFIYPTGEVKFNYSNDGGYCGRATVVAGPAQ